MEEDQQRENLSHELTRSNSDESSLTVDSCKDVFSSPANSLENCAAWTNEMHNSYLNHLEVSFVKQLQQSMGLLNKYTQQNKPADVHDASRKLTVLPYKCCQWVNHESKDHLLNNSSESHNYPKSRPVSHSVRIGKRCSPSSADDVELEFQKACKSVNGERFLSQVLATCAQKPPASGLHFGNPFQSIAEGTGQNFVDEDLQNNSYNQAKKLEESSSR